MKNNNNSHTVVIGWLYPQLMSTYGDRGNILVFKKRCEWRGIKVDIIPIDQNTKNSVIQSIDLLFGGGAQDLEQNIVMKDLQTKKRNICSHVDSDKPALFVCGAPQLMGEYYEPSVGKRIEGLGIFAMKTVHPGPSDDRLIGNVIAKMTNQTMLASDSLPLSTDYIVGFENHGGRTFLGKKATPFAKIIKGYGNNGKDGTEGVMYKNAIGSYLHGPLLPKNPFIADWLIEKALSIKYNKDISLIALDDSLSQMAQESILSKMRITE